MSKIKRKDLNKFLRNLLEPYLYDDYGPNGLQIEGKDEIQKIAFAVSATKDSIHKTIQNGCDTLIVHHGLFWKFHGVRTLTGTFAKRVMPLVRENINLFGYHLPLDANLKVGNAATLASKIGLKDLKPFGDHKGMPTGVWGKYDGVSVLELEKIIGEVCNHSVMTSANDTNRIIKSLGIITGGANNDWYLSKKLGLDAYLTGEMSEHNWNEAKEDEIVMFAAGHHATERFGIQTLMTEIRSEFSVDCIFIDSENPA